MENAEEIFQVLEEFSKRKPKTIPQELNEYLAYVARTGDPVYQWALVKSLFKEKLLNVITDFYDTTPGIDIPPYPNVDPFNYDIMKDSLLERLDSFTSAPFTVQRICELLTYPRKQYNRVDKFMRAIEKNILVVSTREPGLQRHIEQENGEPAEPIVNGSDNNSDYNVDVEMEDVSWKENTEQQNTEPQPSSSDSHITVDNVKTSPQIKQDDPMDTQEKSTVQSDTVVEPVQNVKVDINPQIVEKKISEPEASESTPVTETSSEVLKTNDTPAETENKDVEMKMEPNVLIIPEIKVDDAEMMEHKLVESESSVVSSKEENNMESKESEEPKASVEPPHVINDDSCSSTVSKEDVTEPKVVSEVSTSSEESSSSSDNTDGNSNSPKPDPEVQTDVPVESVEAINKEDVSENSEQSTKVEETSNEIPEQKESLDISPKVIIEAESYSISDVNSEMKENSPKIESKSEERKEEPTVEEKTEEKPAEQPVAENTDKELPVS